ncbi:MAG: rhodanese-related sulfurtransferase [Alphaproteobacteria bacterium]|nr:rhodanese-related sulfurtransferase [Alphaproteobacteria bacterium]
MSTAAASPFKIAALYQFAPLDEISVMREALLGEFKALGICGSLLLAKEGLNGTIAGAPAKLDAALQAISRVTGLSGFEPKFAFASEQPFRRMKVRLKKEIVTIGPVKADPNERVGEYVAPEDWNELISAPDVIVIDTRNAYEFGVGTFKGAIDPCTESFGEFPAWVREKFKAKPNARIAMFCTGGIRCEKASAFMLNEGFEKVYHLKGGILKYLEVIPPEQSLWQGGCYVFDERVAVGHGLKPLDFTTCHGCLGPVSAEDRKSPKYEEGVCCPACADGLSEAQKASNRERQRQVNLAAKRGSRHLGPSL